MLHPIFMSMGCPPYSVTIYFNLIVVNSLSIVSGSGPTVNPLSIAKYIVWLTITKDRQQQIEALS